MTDPTPAAQEAAPESFWSQATPEQLAERLRSSRFVLSAPIARAVRDRAARFYTVQPSQAYLLSAALLEAVRRRSDLPEEALVWAWRCRAEASLYLGRLRSARRAYERACAAAEDPALPDLLGEILVGRVHLLSLLGEAEEAEQLADRADALLRRSGDLAYLAKLHLNRGNVHYQRDRHAEALESYERAARLLEEAGVRDATWAGLLMNQAIACTNLSRPEEAHALFRRTETHCAELGLLSLAAQAQYNRAFLEAARGDYRAALTLLVEAGEVFAREGMRDMTAATRRARAEIYLDLGLPEEAAELAESAAELFTEEQMALDAALARGDHARALLASGRVAEAQAELAEVAAHFRRTRNRPRHAMALLDQAWATLRAGDPPAARGLARAARATCRRLGLQRAVAVAERIVAETWLAERRPGRAEAGLGPALAEAARQPAREQIALWELAGRIARARGRRSLAEARLLRAERLFERQQRLIPGGELRSRSFAEHVGIHQGLVALALEESPPRFALLLRRIEASRARGFRERAGALPGEARRRVAEQRSRLNLLTRQLAEKELPEEGRPDAAAVASLQRRVLALERDLAEELRRMERGGAEAGTATAPSVAHLRARLREDETLIEYFISEERLLALVLSRTARALRVLPAPAGELRGVLARVRFQLESLALVPDLSPAELAFQRQAANAALQALHERLLSPLEDLLPARGRLILIPHQMLHQVPFECLWDGTDYLDARFAIQRAPTASFLLSAPSEPSDGRVLVCGAAAAGLPGAAAELAAAAGRFPPEAVDFHAAITTRELLDAMPRCRLLHISTHGFFREDNPLFSRLTTADGALFLSDLLDRRLRAELVVLSACHSGIAFTGAGEDLSGVAHGFLAAGAQRLVASLWRVHDGATRDLMDAFYRHYTGDAPRDPALALARAAQSIRARWDHPFFWGSFCVQGA